MKKRGTLGLGVLLVAIFLGGCSQLKKLPIVSGYAAKQVCSCTFIAERDLASIEQDDLDLFILKLTSNSIDYENRSATSTVFGLGRKTAVYRENLGCILLHGSDDYHVPSPDVTISTDAEAIFPYGEKTAKAKPKNVDYERLSAAVEGFFDPSGNMDSIKTRSLLVIYKDTILIEKYANGIDTDTELLGWSMTKSIMNAWVGMMVMDGLISVKDTSLFSQWQDARMAISLGDLLQMSSGILWQEDYTTISPATTMLYDSEDVVQTASEPKLAHPPGEVWCYSSGTSNLISGYLRSKFENHNDYLAYPYERIFAKLGMQSTVLESDETGTYVGSSYCYGTTRDWARFGLLYLHDGMWNGERLLPEGWVAYSQEEVPPSDGIYGAHFWLNKRGTAYPQAPHDLYAAKGYQGQRVYIIPSKEMVIVRMGLNENLDFNTLLYEITSSIHDAEQ